MMSVLSSSPMLLEEVDQPPDVVVGVAEEPREDLHHAAVEPALVGRQRVPLGHVGVVARELRVAGTMPSSFWRANAFSR